MCAQKSAREVWYRKVGEGERLVEVNNSKVGRWGRMDDLKTGRRQPRRRKPGKQESTREVQRRRIPEVKLSQTRLKNTVE